MLNDCSRWSEGMSKSNYEQSFDVVPSFLLYTLRAVIASFVNSEVVIYDRCARSLVPWSLGAGGQGSQPTNTLPSTRKLTWLTVRPGPFPSWHNGFHDGHNPPPIPALQTLKVRARIGSELLS